MKGCIERGSTMRYSRLQTLALFLVNYNFVQIHKAPKMTLAMAAGFSGRLRN